jgi:hypothetical protein
MHSMITAEVLGLASAQLVRPDVAQAQWLVYPIALHIWGVRQHRSKRDAFAAVEQLEDFDAWRVSGGVAFRW